jgi:hypothetical protein
MNNVASERWSRYSRSLRARGYQVAVVSGPWQCITNLTSEAEPEVYYLADPLSSDARANRDSAGPKKATTHGLSAMKVLTALLPTFLFIDGKWLWSLNVFRFLVSRKTALGKYDLVLVTGSPWSGMVLTALACQVANLPYAVDFRDLWAAEPSLRFASKIARRYFACLERWIVRRARLILTVNEPIRRYLSELNPSIPSTAIANGFEGTLDYSISTFNSTDGIEKHILYAGSIANYHGVGNFLAAESKASSRVPLKFMGTDFVNALAGYLVDRIPHGSAAEAEFEMRRAGVLLMTLDRRSSDYITGKLMSYVKAGRPILYWGPEDSPAAALIRSHNLGWVIDCSDVVGLHSTLSIIDEALRKNRPFNFNPDVKSLQQYSVESLANILEQSLKKSTAGGHVGSLR